MNFVLDRRFRWPASLVLGLTFSALLATAAEPKSTGDTAAVKSAAEERAPKLETPPEYRTEFRLPSGALVKRGMAAAEVAKLMGAPREKRPLKVGNEVAEVWVYQTDTVSSAPKTIHSEHIVTLDNHQGYVETHSVPQYRIEQTITSDFRELLFFQGRLLNWKESRSVKRSFQ